MTATPLSKNPTLTDHNGLFSFLTAADRWATARDLVVPLGIHAARQHSRLAITITALDPSMPEPKTITVAGASTAALDLLARSRRIRWVAADLVTSATALAADGVQLRQAMCLLLTERMLDAYHGMVPDTSQTTLLPQRYTLAYQRLREIEEAEGVMLLTRLDSANALLAAEMNAGGIGWNTAVHRQLLVRQALKPRKGDPYPRLARVDRDIVKALNTRQVSQWRKLKGIFDGEGVEAFTSYAATLFDGEHPAHGLVARWRKLKLLVSRYGYEWAEQWVREDRWWPVFQPYGTPSGRWSSDGGAMGLPSLLRPCVTAAPDRVLVWARLSQPGPRMWAHLSRDSQLIAACGADDLYAQLGRQLGLERQIVKECLLAAINDDRSSIGKRALVMSRTWFPEAMRYLSALTAQGLRGELVRSGLGRTCPAPDVSFTAALDRPWNERSLEAHKVMEERGKLARAFPIQAAIAELTCALAAEVRDELTTSDKDTRLILFDQAEFVIETTPDNVTAVEYSLRKLVNNAAVRVLGDSGVCWPITVGHGRAWAEAGKK
ncbi:MULTISPECIES: hypothetical protein [unclassified Crossiella]|uniref:hypothetical protein n=1 Tax=unclassified Crossiella TaxID=2620835 RepID=UPI0020000886|nr:MULTISPECIES: hypothetical protein [unclassified Crossiella]MCK2240915.1 hypothetical protein [Crossiella sp. S99.2]MCK2253941.1 hypothetical protein [Crossiella sp. S99.1]